MSNFNLSVREIEESDLDALMNYWFKADTAFLTGMGVDLGKMPEKDEFRNMLMEQLSQPYTEKKSYAIIWQIDNKPIGHSNVSKIEFGEEASMHLHIWNDKERRKGAGAALVKLTLPYYFNNLKLKNIYCEPYALNPAPNKTMAKAGFIFIKNYVTTPGWINFEQPVNRWEMSYDRYIQLKNNL